MAHTIPDDLLDLVTTNALGHVTAIRGDAFIDRMSQRYTGGPYRWRDAAREVFVIEIDHLIARGGR